MSQILNERFSFNNPPHWACAAITDWQVFNDGQRISVADLVAKANQQEEHIQTLLAEVQELQAQVGRSAAPAPRLDQFLTLSTN